jgi:hypothetical protein
MDLQTLPDDWCALYSELVDAVKHAAQAASDPRLSKEDVVRIANSLEVLGNLVHEFSSFTREQAGTLKFHEQMDENIKLFREKMKRQTDLIDSIIEKSEAL